MRKKTYLKLAEYQTEQARQHLNEVRSIHSEMRGYKHDFHHHLQTLKGQLEAGEVERAIAYIEELDNQLMNVDTLLKTGNVSLDAILSAKIAQAKAENITVNVKASVPDLLTITDVELSILVGNLLDNAIEAAEKVENGNVSIVIKPQKKFIIIKVKNSYDGNKNNELQTTKKDKEYHGIGLKSIKRIVEKYQGEFELEFKEKEVEATALLLNV